MDLDGFKDVHGGESSIQKLGQLLVETQNYGAAMNNYAEARYGRRNAEDAEYWHNECMAMLDRIEWLYHEIADDLRKKDKPEQ